MSESEHLPWPQLRLAISKDQADSTEEALFSAGALSVTFLDKNDDPVLEPEPGEIRLWDEIQAVALFSQNTDMSRIESELCPLLGLDELPKEAYSLLPDQIWERTWMDRFEPMKFGERLWICPSHCDPVDPDAVNLRLDPGLAFGSGTHATTALCLAWLDNAELKGKHMLDFGCGSGVLAVAALLLGAEKVTGTDIDPQAMQASRANAELNGVGGRLKLETADELVNNQYDILVANILYQPLLTLRKQFSSLLPPGASLVLSGILKEQTSALIAEYTSDFEFEEPTEKEGWICIFGRRRNLDDNVLKSS